MKPPIVVAPNPKPKKPLITPEERAKKNLENKIFGGGSAKPKVSNLKGPQKSSAPKKQEEDSLIWNIYIIQIILK